MRALVDVPDDLIKDLEYISISNKVSRAEIIRRALRDFVGNNKQTSDGFAIWKNSQVDGLALQEKLREEW